MADVRVTQVGAETLSRGEADLYVTQAIAEAVSRGEVRALVTQVLCETLARVGVPAPPIVTRLRLIRRLRQTPHLSDEQINLYISQLELDLETGKGLHDGQGVDPQIMLQWSDDGGHTWSDEMWVSAGVMGAYRWRAMWRRLGRSRDRVWRITMSDPVPWRLLNAYVQVLKGTS